MYVGGAPAVQQAFVAKSSDRLKSGSIVFGNLIVFIRLCETHDCDE